MSRQLPTQPLPVAPVPIGSYGRNRRFGLWWFIHIEQLLKRLSRRTRSERALVTAALGNPVREPKDVWWILRALHRRNAVALDFIAYPQTSWNTV